MDISGSGRCWLRVKGSLDDKLMKRLQGRLESKLPEDRHIRRQ